MIDTFQLPGPPPLPTSRTFPAFVQWIFGYGDKLLNYFNGWNGKLTTQFNTLLNGYGLDIPSASTITVKNAIHQVTGSIAIQTIAQPTGQTTVGVLTLYAQDGFSLTTGGNIGEAVSVPKGRAIMLAYHPALHLWVTPGSNRSVVIQTGATSPQQLAPNTYVRVSSPTAITENLPPNPQIGDTVTVKKAIGSLGGVTLATTDASNIDGNATAAVTSPAITVIYAAFGQWDIIG